MASLILLLLGFSAGLSQERDSTEYVLHVGHLDFDPVPDTVFGEQKSVESYLATAIHWGYDSVSSRRDTTRLHYPAWNRFQGSTSFVRLNADTLDDILLFVWGTTRTENVERDTIRRIVIFGQSRLRSRNQILVHTLPAGQTSPFFALELARGTLLADPRARDYSGQTSYELIPVSLNVRDTLGNDAVPSLAVPGTSSPGAWVKVYPNPAIYVAYLEGGRIAPGRYQVRLVSSNGQLALEAAVEVGGTGDLFHTLGLAEIATGYYELQLTRSTGVVASYPLVVLH